MGEPRNRIVRVGRYGGPDGLEVVDAPMPVDYGTGARTSRACCPAASTSSSTASARTATAARAPRCAPAACSAPTATRPRCRPAGRWRLASIARLYLWRWRSGGIRGRFYSINAMRVRAQHPAGFKQDLARLFALLAVGTIRPSVAERISFDAMAEAHRRVEAGGLDGKLVLCP